MLPATFLSIIFSATTWETLMIDFKLTLKTWSKSSGFRVRKGSSIAIPALLTSKSIGKTLLTASRDLFQSWRSAQTVWIFESSFTSESRLDLVFERAITVPPNFDRRRAVSLPMPEIEIISIFFNHKIDVLWSFLHLCILMFSAYPWRIIII